MRSLLLVVVVIIAACSSPGASASPEPTDPPTPPPAPKAWSLDVTSAKYRKRVPLGATMNVVVKVKNAGTAANETTEMQIGGLGDHLEFSDCDPECERRDFLGATFLDFPGVPAGKTRTYTIELVATGLGRADWNLAVYDGAQGGDDIYFGEGATTVSG